MANNLTFIFHLAKSIIRLLKADVVLIYKANHLIGSLKCTLAAEIGLQLIVARQRGALIIKLTIPFAADKHT